MKVVMLCSCISFSRCLVNWKWLLWCRWLVNCFFMVFRLLLCRNCMCMLLLLLMVLIDNWWCSVWWWLCMWYYLLVLCMILWKLGYWVSVWLFCMMNVSMVCYWLLLSDVKVWVCCICVSRLVLLKLFVRVWLIVCWVSIFSGSVGGLCVLIMFLVNVWCIVVYLVSFSVWLGMYRMELLVFGWWCVCLVCWCRCVMFFGLFSCSICLILGKLMLRLRLEVVIM